jgi:acyl-coenzyme A synthetase/AMP-(fatty) acid ligase
MKDTVPPPPQTPYRSVLAMIREHARRAPARDCLVAIDQNTALTWRQLYRLTNKLSAWLQAQGIGANDRILVLTDNSLENLILYFGIQRHGATFCTVNVDINAHHMREIIDRLTPKFVLWHDALDLCEFRQTAPGTWVSFGTADPDGATAADGGLFEALNAFDGDAEPDEVSTENDAAVICFTSGTTDRPKGVIHSFGNYNAIGAQTAYLWGLTGDDRVLEYRSFSWSSSHQIVLQPLLLGGGCVVFAPKFSFSRLFDWIRDYRITKAIGIPTVVNMLLNEPPPEAERDVPSLRRMTCSTAPLSPDQWAKFESMYGVTLLQLYGMSEAGWICGNRHYRRAMGTVGPPAKHQEFIIIDGSGDACAPGVEGEITIGGPQTCMGTISPEGVFEDLSESRIKTGDLGMINEDGFVTVTGRTKDLIIRGGVNIAPLEIDNVLLANPKVREAAAVGVPDDIYGEEVIAFVSVIPGEELSEEDLKSWCAASLPAFKAPKQIYFTDDLPKSDRGKVLRDGLRDMWISAK